MDPLSDVLTLLDAKSYSTPGLTAPETWGLHFPGSDGLVLWAVRQGSARVCSSADHEWHTLHQGEAIILTRRQRFAITTLTGTVSGRAETARSQMKGSLADYGGDHLIMRSGKMEFSPSVADPALCRELPPVIYIRTGTDAAAVCDGLMDQISKAAEVPGAGSTTIADHLLHVIIIAGIRGWLNQSDQHLPGWLTALRDPRLLAAISAIHQDPERNWTLPALAEIAGMSRAGFARRFSSLAGCSPLHYLTTWRMHLAAKALRSTTMPVKEIGFSLGYGSESAFSTAFRRIYGCSPVSHRAAG